VTPDEVTAGALVRILLPLSVILLSATGCSGLLHSDTRPEQVYYLRATAPGAKAPAAGDPAQPAVASSIRVAHPISSPGLESPLIVLVQADRRLNFYAGARWPAPVPDVVEALVVETLRSSGSWQSVEDSASPFPSDYILTTTIRRFDADYTSGTGAPEVHVVIECLLGSREARHVIASFVAQGSSTASANRVRDVVAAFDDALNTALASLSEQSLSAVRAASERKH
jgi:cholesterol transport system auxiliary component